MRYEGDIAIIQRRLAETSDLCRRRLAVLDALALRPGEKVLEVGCGGGHLLPMLASSVGERGRVLGIDISPDQIAAARERCSGTRCVEVAVRDVNDLPYEDASIDVIAAIQVIEYLNEPGKALSELRRVSKPGGRLVVLATIWDTMFWNSDAPDLTARIQAAWREHAPHPNFPAELRPLLAAARFEIVHQTPTTILNNAYHEDAFAYWAARLIAAFVSGRGLVSKTDTGIWIQSLEAAQTAGRFFFGSIPILTIAVAT